MSKDFFTASYAFPSPNAVTFSWLPDGITPASAFTATAIFAPEASVTAESDSYLALSVVLMPSTVQLKPAILSYVPIVCAAFHHVSPA